MLVCPALNNAVMKREALAECTGTRHAIGRVERVSCRVGFRDLRPCHVWLGTYIDQKARPVARGPVRRSLSAQ